MQQLERKYIRSKIERNGLTSDSQSGMVQHLLKQTGKSGLCFHLGPFSITQEWLGGTRPFLRFAVRPEVLGSFACSQISFSFSG